MRAIIIDDIKNARSALKADILDYCQGLELVGEAESVQSAFTLIQTAKPNLIFLDVQMNDGTGFDLLQLLEINKIEQPKVIFTTAYDQYAVQAFQFSAVDYLLKPIDFNLLVKAVSKTNTLKKVNVQEVENFVRKPKSEKKIVLHRQDKELIFSVIDILFCHSDGAYTEIWTSNGKKELASKNLKSFESVLQEYDFIRVHHSYLVNKDCIVSFDKHKMMLQLTNGVEIPVSQRKKDCLVNF